VKQAPSWNKVVEAFHNNADIVFGDVELSKNAVRAIHGVSQSPGAGGWPTVRFFNKATGYGGEAYSKKTDMAMCDELGPKENYMQEFVEEKGGTSLCNVNNAEVGCSDKQKAFIQRWAEKSPSELQKQLDRLTHMIDKDGGSLKSDVLSWAKQRLVIFKQLAKTKDEL